MSDASFEMASRYKSRVQSAPRHVARSSPKGPCVLHFVSTLTTKASQAWRLRSRSFSSAQTCAEIKVTFALNRRVDLHVAPDALVDFRTGTDGVDPADLCGLGLGEGPHDPIIGLRGLLDDADLGGPLALDEALGRGPDRLQVVGRARRRIGRRVVRVLGARVVRQRELQLRQGVFQRPRVREGRALLELQHAIPAVELAEHDGESAAGLEAQRFFDGEVRDRVCEGWHRVLRFLALVRIAGLCHV